MDDEGLRTNRGTADVGSAVVRVICPCCRALLSVDARTGSVQEWKESKDERFAADLSAARKVLEEEKERIEAKYREIVKADKEKGSVMDKKFKEFLEKGQPGTQGRPLRDIDLD